MSTTATNRRSVRFSDLNDVLADAERNADRQCSTMGNWSIGQIYKHLATTMNKSIDGFEFTTPFFVRLIGQWYLKRKFLRDGFPAGFQLKGKAAEELVPGETTTSDGLEYLRGAIKRLNLETKRSPHPALGAMSADEWNRLHLRHAELHMSFITEA